MLSAAEIKSGLSQFTGTEAYHRYSQLFKNLVLTDGAYWLAKATDGFWFMDIIGSYQPRLRHEEFQVWTIEKTKSGGFNVTATDGNDRVLLRQRGDYTDFPLDSAKVYVARQPLDDGTVLKVVMVPSEY